MDKQLTLDIDAESFSAREQIIISRLREYRTIGRDIRQQERIISGHQTRCNIYLSGPAVEEDDPAVMAELRTQEMSERFRYIAQTVSKSVDMSDRTYTDSYSVAVKVQNIRSNDPIEDQALQDGYAILTENRRETPVHLTGPERYAECRIKEVADAKFELERLKNLQSVIESTLEDMQQYEHEGYLILWNKYVQGEHWKRVCEIAGRDGAPLTVDEYRWSRKKALQQFDKWAVGLF